MKTITRLLTREMRYEVVPEQDLTIDLGRMPALLRSRFVVRSKRPMAHQA